MAAGATPGGLRKRRQLGKRPRLGGREFWELKGPGLGGSPSPAAGGRGKTPGVLLKGAGGSPKGPRGRRGKGKKRENGPGELNPPGLKKIPQKGKKFLKGDPEFFSLNPN